MISNQGICCIWASSQDFGNLEESLGLGMLFDTKSQTCYLKRELPQFHLQQVFNLPVMQNLHTQWQMFYFQTCSHTRSLIAPSI